MENRHEYCVIMAGGFGNRLWPVSKESLPKQFHAFPQTKNTLLQSAYSRCQGLVPEENILVVTLEKYACRVKTLLPTLPSENLLLEPYAKRTAPCIAYATYEILRRDRDAVIAITPSDIVVMDKEGFRKTISEAFSYVRAEDILMTIGVPPTRPDTSYGYIQVTGGPEALRCKAPIKVKTFTEKPPEGLADVFVRSGEFLWNSGIFVWKADVIRTEMERYLPELTGLFNGWEVALGTSAREEFILRAYTDCDKISIDYGVLEKTTRAWVYQADFDWADLDDWKGVDRLEIFTPDQQGNKCPVGHSCFDNSRGNLVITWSSDKLVAISGLDNFIIVDSGDVLMICPKDERAFKDLVARIGMPGYEQFR